MPKDKNPLGRLMEINDLFNIRKGTEAVVTFKELEDTLDISTRQLRKDFNELRAKGAPLKYIASQRGWRYTEPFDFTDNLPLSADDVLHLRIAMETLSKVNHLEGFQRLPEIFERIRKSVRRWVDKKATEKAIYFDPLPHYEGGVHLAFFLKTIEEHRQVEFQYLAFHATEPKTVVFDPYFLRHYDRRWYLGGFSHTQNENFIRTFPLERIVGKPKLKGFFHDKPKDFDAATYWQHIYGITRPPNGEVEEVDLKFTYIQGKYFVTTPFFKPYEIIEETSDHLIVRLKIIPNFDLTRKLGSLGNGVKVLKPAKLAKALKDFHQKALEQYQE
ncbi:MAG: helix-turn-helix transcriptional regulator [Saprospiraceae bacterium]